LTAIIVNSEIVQLPLHLVKIWSLFGVQSTQLCLYADDAEVHKQIFNRRDKENLRGDLTKLNPWDENWLIKLDISKCEKVSLGRHTVSTEHYSINNFELENVDSIEDLRVIFGSHLKLELHISEKSTKPIAFLEEILVFLIKAVF
jgi:hypothetical protein